MKLYYCETPNPRKACAVAKYLASPTEYVRVSLQDGEHRTPDYRAINPNAKVPALSDGDTHIWESTAIMMYLSCQADSDLWPRDPSLQNEALKWIVWDAAHFSRHGSALMFENYIKEAFGMGTPDPAAIEESLGFFRRFAGVLNEHLYGRSYLLGAQLSIADFSVASMLPSAREAGLPVEDFKEISRWHDRLMDIPAWREPWPSSA